MSVLRAKLIGKFAAPDALATLACAGWIAALEHETLDIAVEDRAIIIAGRGEREKVEGGSRHRVAVYLELDVAVVGV